MVSVSSRTAVDFSMFVSIRLPSGFLFYLRRFFFLDALAILRLAFSVFFALLRLLPNFTSVRHAVAMNVPDNSRGTWVANRVSRWGK